MPPSTPRALKVHWSDGHNTGIYTYDRLLALCPCPACTQGSA